MNTKNSKGKCKYCGRNGANNIIMSYILSALYSLLAINGLVTKKLIFHVQLHRKLFCNYCEERSCPGKVPTR